MISTDRVFMTPLDFPRVDFTGSEHINLLLTSASFWHQLQGEKILYFQINSVICSNSIAQKFSIESISHPRPFAVHKPNFQRFGSVNIQRFCHDCLEVKIKRSSDDIFFIWMNALHVLSYSIQFVKKELFFFPVKLLILSMHFDDDELVHVDRDCLCDLLNTSKSNIRMLFHLNESIDVVLNNAFRQNVRWHISQW